MIALIKELFISFACPKETNQRKGQKIYTEPSHWQLPDTDIFSGQRIRQLADFSETIRFDRDVLSIYIMKLSEKWTVKAHPDKM